MLREKIKQTRFRVNSIWFLVAISISVIKCILPGTNDLVGTIGVVVIFGFMAFCDITKKYTYVCFVALGGSRLLYFINMIQEFVVGRMNAELLAKNAAFTLVYCGLALLSLTPFVAKRKLLLQLKYVPAICMAGLTIYGAWIVIKVIKYVPTLHYLNYIKYFLDIVQNVAFTIAYYQLAQKYSRQTKVSETSAEKAVDDSRTGTQGTALCVDKETER